MEHRIELITETKLVGKHVMMSFSSDKTFALWNSFMPNRKEIRNAINNRLISAEVFPANFFEKFNPTTEFEKWALVEVTDHDSMPEGMETKVFPAGEYAVFIHRGLASEAPRSYNYIFSVWIPQSEYKVDTRPHFAIMDEKYNPNDPNSEEELWIPIVRK